MAVIVNGDGILTGISSLATALTDLTSGRGTVTGVATVGTLQLGAGVSISSPRTQTAAIFTNNTEFLTIDDAGRVGVGTITPNSDAHPENEKKINVGFITAKSIAGDIDARNIVAAGVGTFIGAASFSADATINGVTVGKGANSVSTNVVLGISALDASVTGDNNVAIGNVAMSGATTAADSTAVGAGALNAVTTGSYNTAVGKSALLLATTGSNILL